MNKREIILTVLEHGAEITSKLLYLYGTISLRENAWRFNRLTEGRFYKRLDWVTPFQEAQVFYSTLSYLRAEGFIRKRKGADSTLWTITKKGIEKLRKVKTAKPPFERLSRRAHMLAATVKVVVFDIPERDRKQRAWLRRTLAAMGFSLMQKSVWIGKRTMPQEFFFELRRRKIFRHIHIFAVGNAGSIHNILP